MTSSVLERPAIVTCALVGGPIEVDNPHYPRTFDDLVREGIEAARAGAAVLHLHARTRSGELTQDPETYRATAEAIGAEAGDVVFNFTTTGSIGMSDEERLCPLAAGSELATIDCGSLNWGDGVLATSPAFIRRALGTMREHGVRPELHALDAGWADAIGRLVTEGLIDPPPIVHMMLGGGAAPARVDTLAHLVSLLPKGAVWSGGAVGDDHFRIVAAALALGGHVRTGLEDVTHIEPGVHARSNAQLVERVVALCRAIGRPVATPAEARAALGFY